MCTYFHLLGHAGRNRSPDCFSNDVYLQFPPEKWGFGLFQGFFHSSAWMRATLNSFKVAIPVMILATILGTMASLSWYVEDIKESNSGMPSFFPPSSSLLSSVHFNLFFLAKLKLIGTVSGLILAHTVLAVPYVVIVMTSTLKGFDVSLEQASMNLGAGRLRTFFNITFPLSDPVC